MPEQLEEHVMQAVAGLWGKTRESTLLKHAGAWSMEEFKVNNEGTAQTASFKIIPSGGALRNWGSVVPTLSDKLETEIRRRIDMERFYLLRFRISKPDGLRGVNWPHAIVTFTLVPKRQVTGNPGWPPRG